MASSSIRSFGFVGLGLMGKPMSMNLASKMEDHQHLYIYDLAKSVVSEVCESNPQRITRCQSAKEVAEKADFIITMLPEGKHVKTVYIDGAINLCSTDLSGKTLVDCSTIDAATTLLVKNHIKQHFPDTPFYDAPVSGGTVGAIKATIAFFLDCSEADQNLPLLQAILGTMGKEIIPCGGPSLGIVSKLCNNYLSGSITIASSEAFDMGIRAGVDPKHSPLARIFIMSTDPKFDTLHKQLFEEGLKVRRAVVGDAYIDRALENGSTEFSRPGQELVTEWCWGYAWTRPGLERRDRSLINIPMLMALNRQPELAVHVRGARNNGVSELEIREAIIHATTYCGVPAGVDAFKTAEKVFDDMEKNGEAKRELSARSDKA
ncbi:hypothetical protein E4T38_06339 [Aureobasidium subglaciale]|nr:hypothetical protein E4T38_06339 [Aureobasidium subglaciale]KAI5219541.1 hypothetical protein E4T40_06409 [Aureobasidium subglaciale]KAI5223166.1 hypothetical protein E4T41_06249 [Aureobasidium subglaciale]KAI5259787.1 hypothetical protein E4T46_06684 [Aureobasidium subglaciale]